MDFSCIFHSERKLIWHTNHNELAPEVSLWCQVLNHLWKRSHGDMPTWLRLLPVLKSREWSRKMREEIRPMYSSENGVLDAFVWSLTALWWCGYFYHPHFTGEESRTKEGQQLGQICETRRVVPAPFCRKCVSSFRKIYNYLIFF